MPRQRIFGSDELSAAQSRGWRSWWTRAYLELTSQAAAEAGLRDGDGVVVGENLAVLEVRINDQMAPGCAGFSAGLEGTFNLSPGALEELRIATDWQRRPDVIGSDGGEHV